MRASTAVAILFLAAEVALSVALPLPAESFEFVHYDLAAAAERPKLKSRGRRPRLQAFPPRPPGSHRPILPSGTTAGPSTDKPFTLEDLPKGRYRGGRQKKNKEGPGESSSNPPGSSSNRTPALSMDNLSDPPGGGRWEKKNKGLGESSSNLGSLSGQPDHPSEPTGNLKRPGSSKRKPYHRDKGQGKSSSKPPGGPSTDNPSDSPDRGRRGKKKNGLGESSPNLGSSPDQLDRPPSDRWDHKQQRPSPYPTLAERPKSPLSLSNTPHQPPLVSLPSFGALLQSLPESSSNLPVYLPPQRSPPGPPAWSRPPRPTVPWEREHT